MTHYAPLLAGDARRVALVRQVTELLRGAASEERTVLVSVLGDAGHGKSHLLAAIQAGVAERGLPMITVTGSPATAGIPYAAIFDMLVNEAPHLASRALLDELSSFRATATPLAVSSAVMAWMRARSQGRPLVLVIDDADLVDEDSLRVIAYAAVRDTSPLSVLHTATRPVPLLERLLVRGFLLEDLTDDAALALARRCGADDAVSRRLIDTFGGNPLAVVHGCGGPGIPRRREWSPRLAERLVDDVRQRLEPQSPETLRILQAAAVTEVSATSELAGIAGTTPGAFDVIADEIEASGVAVIDADDLRWCRRWMRFAVAQRCPTNRRNRWLSRAGDRIPPPRAGPQILQGEGPSGPGLTAAERRVVEVVVTGASTREAAHCLHLSNKTVEAHLQSIYRKLDVHSRVQLAALHFTGALDSDSTTTFAGAT